MGKPPSGRLVLNHSTHIPGLIAVLEKLTVCKGIRTVTPGVIGRAKGHCPQMKLKISVPIRGGYKIIARQGKTVQEVFVIAELTRKELESAIASCLGK
ncbi:DUF2103 domain-containing protein [Phormidium sp. CCY1219]|jgi:hypothetical protein|uniref:DUF2103 domain-containing protein n=1 Tax=Phormidium sp. CCY1219 TaxID=2886104 RepID=UPI002D1E7130|nr:DUF2103 domain-containing protein [Phormidium sp. CCY1219]MEB3827679.1 DUF2103 domain-containing protein [Phormidium sp. CCY1219]